MTEAKYQISMTDGKGGIYVIRSENKEDITLDLEWLRALLGDREKVASQSPTTPQTPIVLENRLHDKTYCSLHNVDMKQRVGKDEKVFYSHAKQVDGNWIYCSGFGFGGELRKQVDRSFNK